MPIHIEPDEIRQTGRQLLLGTLDMLDAMDTLRADANRLDMSWWGGGASEYQADLAYVLRQLSVQIERLHLLGLTLQHEAERWEESDLRWTVEFARILGNG
jgi:uncharacterized protein YukE